MDTYLVLVDRTAYSRSGGDSGSIKYPRHSSGSRVPLNDVVGALVAMHMVYKSNARRRKDSVKHNFMNTSARCAMCPLLPVLLYDVLLLYHAHATTYIM